jgi:hypothetical protein
MLEPGNYIVYTRDSIGCIVIDSVTVSTQVSTTTIRDQHFIQIYPNPGKGVYQVNAVLQDNDVFVDYSIFNTEGELVLHGALARYNEKHKGEISLIAYPSGIYFISFYVNDAIISRRLIKSE